MQSFFLRTRFALVAAVSLALFIGGLASGSAGLPLVLGRPNSAGTETTQLGANTASEPTFLVQQEGSGTALRAEAHAGIAGFFSSGDGSGVSGVSGHPQNFGVYAGNDAEEDGGGAALRAKAIGNAAIVATSEGTAPIAVYGPEDEPPLTVDSSVRVDGLHADGVDGWSFGCPPETVWGGGICLEASPRAAASVLEAADRCAATEGERGWAFHLPTALQLRAAAADGVDLSPDGEHSDSLYGTSDGLTSLVVAPDGGISVGGAEEERAFRCATAPLWPDGSMETGE